jgi:hypothetical protein
VFEALSSQVQPLPHVRQRTNILARRPEVRYRTAFGVLLGASIKVKMLADKESGRCEENPDCG